MVTAEALGVIAPLPGAPVAPAAPEATKPEPNALPYELMIVVAEVLGAPTTPDPLPLAPPAEPPELTMTAVDVTYAEAPVPLAAPPIALPLPEPLAADVYE